MNYLFRTGEKVKMSFSIGVPDKTKIFWADMKETKAELDEFVNAPFADKISVLVILGDYGTGKTHSLDHIGHSTLGLPIDKLKICLFEHPFGDFIDFLAKIESVLPFEEAYVIVKNTIKKRKSQVATILKEGYDKDILDSVMVFEKSRHLVLKTLYPEMNSDLRIVFAKIIATETKEIFDLAKKWLTSSPLTPTQLRDLGVSGRITTSNAADISADYLRIYLSEGGHLVVLIDEFEDLGVIGEKETLVNFRHFLDQNLPRFKMVITMTDAAFEGMRTGKTVFLRKPYPPLHDRLNVCKKVRLANLTKKNSKVFLKDYLTSYNKDLKGKIALGLKAIDAIHNRTDGSPRLLSSLCNYLLSSNSFSGHLSFKTASEAMDEMDFRKEESKTVKKASSIEI
jgi:hypothetical protein